MRGQNSLWHVVQALHSAFMQFETQSNLHRSSLQVSTTSSAVAPIAGTFAVETAAIAACWRAAAASLGAIAFGKSHCRERSRREHGPCSEASVSSKIVLWWWCSYNGCVALVSLGDVLGLVAEGACGPRAYLVHLGAQSIVIVRLAVHGAPVASNDCQQREQHHEWPDSAGWHMSARHRRCASSDEDPMLCDCGPICVATCVWGWGGSGGGSGRLPRRAQRGHTELIVTAGPALATPPAIAGWARATWTGPWGGNGRRLENVLPYFVHVGLSIGV